MVESLVVEFNQSKYEEFLSFSSKSPKARQYRKVSSKIRSQSLRRLPRMRFVQRTSWSDVSHVRPVSTSPMKPARSTLLTISPLTPLLFLSSRLPWVPNNPYDVTGTPNVDRGDMRVNYRRKKLKQLSVQQIQDVRFKPASLLNHVRRTKSAFGNLNAKLTKLVFLKLHFPNAIFSSAKSMPLIRDTRPASL